MPSNLLQKQPPTQTSFMHATLEGLLSHYQSISSWGQGTLRTPSTLCPICNCVLPFHLPCGVSAATRLTDCHTKPSSKHILLAYIWREDSRTLQMMNCACFICCIQELKDYKVYHPAPAYPSLHMFFQH